MTEVDLNISNYSLSDILKLFKLEHGLDEAGMKKAKRQVLLMHPDKSNLSKEYFLFFSSAYKLLYKVYEFHQRNNEDTTIRREYTSEHIDDQQANREVWSILSKQENFSEVFNGLFEECIEDKNDGYGKWFGEEEEYLQAKTLDEMNSFIAEKKKNLSAMIVFQDIREPGGTHGTSLIEEEDMDYQAGLFSVLQYDDLKHAYTETVVPVTEEDYEKRTKYHSVDHLQRARHNELQETFLTANHHSRLQHQREQQQIDDMERAYSLAKQDEEIKKQTNQITSKLLRIAN